MSALKLRTNHQCASSQHSLTVLEWLCQPVKIYFCTCSMSSTQFQRQQVKMQTKECYWDYNMYNITRMPTAAQTSLHQIRKSWSTIRMLFLSLLTPNTDTPAICLPVLAFMVAGLLWLLPFMAEIPMPYSVAGRRSEAQKQEQNQQELRSKVMR